MYLRDNYQLFTALLTAYNAGYSYVKASTPAVAADGYVIITEAPNLIAGASNDTIDIAGTVFTASDGAPATNTEFDASGTDLETAANLMNAINSHPTANGLVSASMSDPTVPKVELVVDTTGASGNLYALDYTSNYTYSGLMVSGTTFQGGSDEVAAGEAYGKLTSGLAEAAAEGRTSFSIISETSHAPETLRLENRYLDTYYAGIIAGLASERIFDYEVSLSLVTTDTETTRIKFTFSF
jgi:hypothetical protein